MDTSRNTIAAAVLDAGGWSGTTRRFKVLRRAEERRLVHLWYAQGDRAARDLLIASHLRLVRRIAQKYVGYGIALADLIGEGNLGLLQSAARFDPARGFRFSTYARWWIRAAILNFILQTWSLIRVGNGSAKKRMFFNLRRAKVRLGADGRSLSTAEAQALARSLGVTPDEIVAMDQRLAARDISLHEPLHGQQTLTVGDTIAADGLNPEEALLAADDAQRRSAAVRRALAALDNREREIVTQRYLVDSPATLAHLATCYGVTAERVRQIEARAILKLRDELAKAGSRRAPRLAAMLGSGHAGHHPARARDPEPRVFARPLRAHHNPQA